MKRNDSSLKHAKLVHQQFWTPTRIAVTALTTCLLVALGVSSCQSRDETAKVKPYAPSAPANPAPAVPPTLPANLREVEMRSANGSAIKLANYSGKVLLVNLWATWCGPCRLETPELVKLHKEYGRKGLQLVGLSTENPDASAESVRNFVRAFDVDYPVGWATPEVAIAFMQVSGRNAIPQSFIIAPDGTVLNHFVGFSPSRTPDQLREAIELALSGHKAD